MKMLKVTQVMLAVVLSAIALPTFAQDNSGKTEIYRDDSVGDVDGPEKKFRDNTDYNYRGTIVNRLLTCQSNGSRTQTCDSGLRRIRAIYLVRQLSRSSCDRYSVSVSGPYLTVSNGCRGEFEVEGIADTDDRTDIVIGAAIEKEFYCSSDGGRYQYCPVTGLDEIQGIRLDRQVSRTTCIEEQNFRINRKTRNVEVWGGCRAYFQVRGTVRN